MGEKDQINGSRPVRTSDTVDLGDGSMGNDFCEPGKGGGNSSYVGY